MQKLGNFNRRIGTRGFLAPEIVFNAKDQGKGVDIWAAGIILLSFFAKRMPVLNLNKFSKIKDISVREIIPLILIWGPEKIIEIATKYGVSIYIPDTFKPYILQNGLITIIVREDVDDSAYDLLISMLELDSNKRISAEAALQHSFFQSL